MDRTGLAGRQLEEAREPARATAPKMVAYRATDATAWNSPTRRGMQGRWGFLAGGLRVKDAARTHPWARVSEKRRNSLDRRAS